MNPITPKEIEQLTTEIVPEVREVVRQVETGSPSFKLNHYIRLLKEIVENFQFPDCHVARRAVADALIRAGADKWIVFRANTFILKSLEHA